MHPTLKLYGYIIIDTKAYKILENEIWVYKRNKNIAVKRIKYTQEHLIFVIGDNSKNSINSRHLGLIDKSHFIGKVSFIFHN